MPPRKGKKTESPGQQPLLDGEDVGAALVDAAFPFFCACQDCECAVQRKRPGVCTLCEIGAHGLGVGGFACIRM